MGTSSLPDVSKVAPRFRGISEIQRGHIDRCLVAGVRPATSDIHFRLTIWGGAMR
jgi:hypothetical protein